jgi:hypothetical protein
MMTVKRMSKIVAGASLVLLLAAGSALAASATISIDDHLGRIERILGDVERTKDVLTGSTAAGDVARAQETLRRREADLERARVDAMSASSGLSRDRIAAMRASGKSWGGIARDLNVSPHIIGVGPDGKDVKGKGYEKTAGTGKKKGWKGGMPPGQAKKAGYDD